MPRKLNPNQALFSIGAVAEILGVKPRTLRIYEEKGLVFPSRSDTNRRLYSLNDIDILAYINYLTNVRRVNLAGVLEIQKIIMKMDDKNLEAFMKEVEREIEDLSLDKKQALVEGTEQIIEEVASTADHNDMVKEQLVKLKEKKADKK